MKIIETKPVGHRTEGTYVVFDIEPIGPFSEDVTVLLRVPIEEFESARNEMFNSPRFG